jgi:hypothetical protein
LGKRIVVGGGCWTTFHLRHEREAAELLGIPFESVM